MTRTEARDLIARYDAARDAFDIENGDSQLAYSEAYSALTSALMGGAA